MYIVTAIKFKGGSFSKISSISCFCLGTRKNWSL